MSNRASLIAFAFVTKGIEDGIPVTQMKLQKLVYFAHGLHLAVMEKPIIKEMFQAWKFGPVVPEIYHDFKVYGSSPITDIETLKIFDLVGDFDDEKLKALDKYTKQCIDTTWSTLKNSNALSLSAWTHKEGSPWHKFYKEGVTDITIPNEEIQRYFKVEIIKKDA